MPSEDNNLVKDLNQIKRRQEKIAEDLDRLKENADAGELEDLERIEAGIYKTILDIDEINKKRDAELQTEIERNTILFRMKPRNPNQQRTRCGRITF